MKDGYNLLNGFERAGSNSSSTEPTRDNPLMIYGTMDFNGTYYTGTHLQNILKSTIVTDYSTATAILTSGVAIVAGGTGLAMTLAAPTAGCVCDITVASLASGSVTVKAATGVTFDGTNNTATFGTATNQLKIVYKSATRWQIVYNSGVTFSST